MKDIQKATCFLLWGMFLCTGFILMGLDRPGIALANFGLSVAMALINALNL